MSETTLRQIKLLELLPRQPLKKSPQQLKDSLANAGFDVSERTVQRDLKSLSSLMPLISDERNKPFGWSWHKDASGLNPAMDPLEALSLSLAQEYLEPLMPTKSYKRLKIFFERANSILKEMPKSKLNNWRNNVRVVPQWQKLISPSINEKTEAEIYDALLNGKQLNIEYKKRNSKTYDKRAINPLGLVLQGSIHRLICTMVDDNLARVRHLPLHRFRKAESNENKSKKPKNFNLDNFIKTENLGFLLSEKPIKLEALFNSFAGFHLNETPLSKDQELKVMAEGKIKIKATVADTSQLRWWLLGFGPQVEVIKPKFLRNEFLEYSNGLFNIYKEN